MSVESRAVAALLGLAAGDALGLPAEYHRVVRNDWLRPNTWALSSALDAQQVSRPIVPFTVTLDGLTDRVGTDDTERAALAAAVLLAADDHGVDALFDEWLRHHGPDAWLGVAERSAVINAGHGLRPPQTGNDNPARADDSAVAASVPIGVAYFDDPAGARAVATRYASIAHADDGVWAAALMAEIVARAVAGESLVEAVAEAQRSVPADSWLAESVAAALEIARSTSGFVALPPLIARFAPRNYSHPTQAAETLPLAIAIAVAAGGRIEEALPLALASGRTSDSVPAMVGALCGASGSSLPHGWLPGSETVQGILHPTLTGLDLPRLAISLVTR